MYEKWLEGLSKVVSKYLSTGESQLVHPQCPLAHSSPLGCISSLMAQQVRNLLSMKGT